METIVLGIDPGLAQTGYGVIAAEPSRYRYIDHGTIATKPDVEGYGRRLSAIFDELSEVIARYAPAAAGVELLYFAKNSTSAIPVAQARGVILLALHRAGVPTFEFPPQEIKQAITGSGRADKGQVQELVRVLLGLTHIPKPDHAADALAAAICSYHHFSARERIEAARV
jgi:crossover junction endodeoxyribonuclease RuvC